MKIRALSANRPLGQWGVAQTPVGAAVLGFAQEGIFWLSFGAEQSAIDELHDFWGAELPRDDAEAQTIADKIFIKGGETSYDILAEGSPFQLNAWNALLAVPFGSRITYGQLATQAGCPGASRAIGTAIGKNNISYLVPCHRIVRSGGSPGNYRWGSHVKSALLDWEQRSNK